MRRPDKQLAIKRHRLLARSINARIFQSYGRLYLHQGIPELEAIYKYVSGLSLQAIQESDPVLATIAFSSGCDGELTMGFLNEIHISLETWADGIGFPQSDSDRTSRPIKCRQHRTKADKSRLRNEQLEITRLRERVSTCFGLLKKLKKSQNEDQREFVLTQTQRQELEQLLELKGGTKLTRFEERLTEIVYWFSGRHAAFRYASAIANVPRLIENHLEKLDRRIAWLGTLQIRAKSEPVWPIREQLKSDKAYQDLIEWIRQNKAFRWFKCNGNDIHVKLAHHISVLRGAMK